MKILAIALENVKVILILDNSPAYPSIEKLCSRDGRIQHLMLLPSNITPLAYGLGNYPCL
jgi:hypothetical protein